MHQLYKRMGNHVDLLSLKSQLLNCMYQHNTCTLNNAVIQGCSDQHWISKIEPTKTYAPYMKAAGYATPPSTANV
jgi:hypothetical protein